MTTKTKQKDLTVKHEGVQLILPVINGKAMTYDEGIEWLKRKKAEDEQPAAVHHEFECAPLDGLVAFHKALTQHYGWTQNVKTPGNIFTPDKPPVMVGIPVGPNEVMQVAYGRVEIPGVDGFLQTMIGGKPVPKFIIGGTIRSKHLPEIKVIADLTRKLLAEQSIYKGRAIKIGFDWIKNEEEFDPVQHAPKFMDLKGVSEGDLLFNEKVMGALDIGLFTPIEQSEACRKYKIPLKRGVLLAGPYGTGKTMTAYVAALKAIKHGWTFIYLNSVSDLQAGLLFAAKYAPAVLFAEDIDRVITGDRSLDMDDVLNTLDGVDTKGAEIITVFTTNHLENINPAALRMGRLDTLVDVMPPDARTAEKLVTLYTRGLLADGSDLSIIGRALDGQIPAFIREVCERAKIAAIARTNGGSIEGRVKEEDLLVASKAMQSHADLLKPRPIETPKNAEVLVRLPSTNTRARDILRSYESTGAA